MSGFKGTPGPWFWDKEGLGSESHMVFGSVYPVGMTSEENKSLISAAPELLEALQAAMEWIDSDPQYAQLPTMPGFDRDWVDVIIAKALGVSDE